MVSLVIILFLLECSLFFYSFIYGVILNILLWQNKEIIENHFKELGYKIYSNNDGEKISRNARIKVIQEFISNNENIKNKNFFYIVLKKFNSLYFIFGLMIFIALIIMIVYSIMCNRLVRG